MIQEENVLLKYEDVLKQLENQESHLLLWNGFNRGLWVDTSYQSIFQKMTESDNWIYKDVIDLVKKSNYDLELFIWNLLNDIKSENKFLKKYITNKVKFDFMKATHEIVKSEIKNIYAEKNEWIYMLLKNFTNYFTLNYDSFLYLLLLNFKSNDDNDTNKTIAIQPSLKFQAEDMNLVQNNIYSEIKEARRNWSLEIIIGWDIIFESMNTLTKTNFINTIRDYSKKRSKGWKKVDIERVVNRLLEEEKNKNILEKIDDWYRPQVLFDNTKEYVFDLKKETQNLFFLHGAFHLFVEWWIEKKITQKFDKALYDRLEEILNSEERDILCVFQDENKIDEINKSEYLKKSYSKLSQLSWNMVIIGSSLAKNDKHIFNQINISWIHTIYISTRKESFDKNYKQAISIFKNKNIIMFEAESISYEPPEERN